jgi:hypothetical protein
MKNLLTLITCCLSLAFIGAKAQSTEKYNSYPSATATVYLDFDGHLVNGTSWNTTGPINCGPSNVTPAQITEIFNRVSEDYRPFNINITTDSLVYWAAPTAQRMRVILTVTSSWYGAAGGVSYIGSFTWGDNTPAFVFTALLNYNTKNIAEATSHEIGHTLGLKHQASYDVNCLKLTEYNAGMGSGEIGWAPIMGNGYYRNLTLWNNGANPYGCTNYQDDLGIITSGMNGFGYRQDDYSNTSDAMAAGASFVNNQFNIKGVIEKITDQDVFQFTVPSFGNVRVDATPYSVGTGDNGSNLDMQVELLGSGGNVLGTYNPDLLLSSRIDTMLNPGTYYLRVQGKGNMYAPEYASLGSYSLQGTFSPSVTLPVHRLQLQGRLENGHHLLDWTIDADEQVASQALEVSTDGSHFIPLATLSNSVRKFSYAPMNEGPQYYRMNVLFDNGRSYYSNIISLRSAVSKPRLRGNIVGSTIFIESPSPFNYMITDLGGRLITKGRLVQGSNNISSDLLHAGVYLIKFSNNQQEFSEKLMKE